MEIEKLLLRWRAMTQALFISEESVYNLRGWRYIKTTAQAEVVDSLEACRAAAGTTLGVINDTNGGCFPFRWSSSRVLLHAGSPGASQWSRAGISFISCTCAVPAVMSQNGCREESHRGSGRRCLVRPRNVPERQTISYFIEYMSGMITKYVWISGIFSFQSEQSCCCEHFIHLCWF